MLTRHIARCVFHREMLADSSSARAATKYIATQAMVVITILVSAPAYTTSGYRRIFASHIR